MTDADIRSRLDLFRSIDRTSVDLPIATVERLMATGRKIRVGKGSVKAGKFKRADTAPVSAKIGRKAKADRTEKALRANRARAKG